MSLNQPNLHPAIVGICIGMICSIPVAAYLASFLGDTYQIRATVYCSILLWCVIGAFVVFRFMANAKNQPLNLRHILLWVLSLWLWPILCFTHWVKHRS